MKVKPENRFWIGIYGFTAFIMLTAMSVFGWLAWTSRSEPGTGRVAGGHPAPVTGNSIPEEEFDALAAFPAPEYSPRPGAPKAFESAMALYAKQDYADAASALRSFTNAQPDFTAARFYLGISLLLAQDRIGGIQELRGVAEAGEGEYLERAQFYLAKGLLSEHDLARARKQLQDVVARHGALEKEATALLDQIRSS